MYSTVPVYIHMLFVIFLFLFFLLLFSFSSLFDLYFSKFMLLPHWNFPGVGLINKHIGQYDAKGGK